ncbi:RNA 2',3'-cyclic phosphodiesterase [Patescibacteria group bacterium]
MEGNTSHRIFVAINLPPATKKEILYWQHEINDKSLALNWTPVEKIHLTMLFLGNITEWEIKKLSGLIDDAISEFRPFSLNLRRFGVIKRQGRPSVFYIKPRGCRRLTILQTKIAEAAKQENIGKISRRSFQPHITLGRFRSGEIDRKLLSRWRRQKVDINFSVRSVDIMTSDMSLRPSQYTKLHSSYFDES